MALKNCVYGCGFNSNGVKLSSVAGSCEYYNEHTVFINLGRGGIFSPVER